MAKAKEKIQTGRSASQQEALERFFGGMKVIEAKENLRIFASEDDKRNANRSDPEKCVLARACQRLFGSSAVLIFKSRAYVDLPDKNGIRQVNRFTVGPAIRDLIITYDKTGEFPAGGFVIKAPKLWDRLDHQRKFAAKREAAIKNGSHTVDPRRSALMKGVKRAVKQAALLTGVRDGTGMVHFIEKSALR